MGRDYSNLPASQGMRGPTSNPADVGQCDYNGALQGGKYPLSTYAHFWWVVNEQGEVLCRDFPATPGGKVGPCYKLGYLILVGRSKNVTMTDPGTNIVVKGPAMKCSFVCQKQNWVPQCYWMQTKLYWYKDSGIPAFKDEVLHVQHKALTKQSGDLSKFASKHESIFFLSVVLNLSVTTHFCFVQRPCQKSSAK
jgi:hypothetical protein